MQLVMTESDNKIAQQRFLDLIMRLKSGLGEVQCGEDLESLMNCISEHLKNKNYTSDQKKKLRSLRQKGYDLRSQFRISEEGLTVESEFPLPSEVRSAERPIKSNHIDTSRSFDVLKILNAYLPSLPLIIGAISVNILLWMQSVELYESSGFSSPKLVALGGILMILGFAAYHSKTKSKLAFMMCLYVGGYETYFIASGTISDEATIRERTVQNSNAFTWHNENVIRKKDIYEKQKSRYENPNSKEYQNGWFKKKYLDPAWKEYSAAQEKIQKHLATFSDQSFDHVTLLKILYRLGLVFLSMLLIHNLCMTAKHHLGASTLSA